MVWTTHIRWQSRPTRMELADSPLKDRAHEKLMALAQQDGDAHLLEQRCVGLPIVPKSDARRGIGLPKPGQSAAIETTGYALLALVEGEDLVNASRAAKWLAGQRNAYGGFGSTQDTVVGLQALTAFSTVSRTDVDVTVTLESGRLAQRSARHPGER